MSLMLCNNFMNKRLDSAFENTDFRAYNIFINSEIVIGCTPFRIYKEW